MIIISRLQDRIHVKQKGGLIGKMPSVFWVPPRWECSRRVGTQEVGGDLGAVHTPPFIPLLSAHPLPLPSSADRVDGFQGARAGCAHRQLSRQSQLPSSLPCRGLD